MKTKEFLKIVNKLSKDTKIPASVIALVLNIQLSAVKYLKENTYFYEWLEKERNKRG